MTYRVVGVIATRDGETGYQHWAELSAMIQWNKCFMKGHQFFSSANIFIICNKFDFCQMIHQFSQVLNQTKPLGSLKG